MKNIDDDEKILAWDAIWHPSLAGIAIVSGDFQFIAVNPQFCEIVGVTPQALLNGGFVDITPEPYKSEDTANAELVKEGRIQNYSMPKEYELRDGTRKKIILLVSGVYDQNNQFLFFVSTIMERGAELKQNTQSQSAQTIFRWIDINKILTALGLGLVAFALAWLNGLIKV